MMLSFRVFARFSREQLRNHTVYYSSLSNRTYYKKNYASSGSKNEIAHQLTINPDDEISHQELAEKSTLENWKETFGSLTGYSDKPNLDEISEAERQGEIEPHRRLSKDFRKHEPDWYGRKIERLGRKGQVYEAIQVLEKEMLVDDRVMPNNYVFTTLIGILGRVGHHQKAFKLFNQMKKFGIKPTDPTYTAIFNSFSNSPNKEDALERAIKLRELMKEKEISVNVISHQAMIKAFAHLGDMRTAFKIADEALNEGLKLSGDTYSFLLMACIADKEAGTSLSIKLWRMMRAKQVEFGNHHYNLLLRCIRDCGMGNEAIFVDLLGTVSSSISKDNLKLFGSQEPTQMPKTSTRNGNGEPQEVLYEVQDPGDQIMQIEEHQASNNQLSHPERDLVKNFPNILNPKFNMTFYKNWKLSLPKDPVDRLFLLGGAENILKHMKKDNCLPTIKTFSLLLELVPSSLEAEDDLIVLMENNSVKPDLTFFNLLIRKRCMRKHYRNARDVLDLIVQHRLHPDDMTFGCLAMGCSTENRGMNLLKDMMKINKLPNAEICDNLIFASNMDFRYKYKIVKFMKDNQIRPNIKALRKLEANVQYAKKKILEAEMGKGSNEYYKSEEFLRGFEIFLMNYRQWLNSVEFEPQIDPLVRYGQPTPQIPD